MRRGRTESYPQPQLDRQPTPPRTPTSTEGAKSCTLDPDYPATLSYKTLTEVLRNQLHFDGVILTDDMYMQGIVDNYDIAEAIILAINAGADILVMGNNITTGYESERPFKVVDIIVNAVKQGKIPAYRLRQSYERIRKLKRSL